MNEKKGPEAGKPPGPQEQIADGNDIPHAAEQAIIHPAPAHPRPGLGPRRAAAVVEVARRQCVGGRLMSACPSCGVDPCANPSFCSTCRDADRQRARGERPRYVSEWHDWPAVPERHPRPTPEVTIEAI